MQKGVIFLALFPLAMLISGTNITSSREDSNSPIICGNRKEDETRLKVIDVAPFPSQLTKGEFVSIEAHFDVLEEVTSGTIEGSLLYESVTIFSTVWDLCDLAIRANIACPVKKGPLTVKTGKISLPHYAPSGQFEGKAILTNQAGKEILCMKLLVQLK